jgi:multidrug efflux pump subunit AcrA (membrane-fusion protein)
VTDGQSGVVTLSADSKTMDGTVSEVSPAGETSSNVVEYPVTINVADPVSTARIGASVSVVITTGSADNTLVLQTSAITTTGTRSVVELLKNGVTTPTQVTTGLVGSSTTEIKSGLSAGDVVQIPTTSSSSSSSGVPGFGGGGLGGGTGTRLGGGNR